VSSLVLEKIKTLNEKVKEREDVRVKYDHYRIKVSKMQKEGRAESNDMSKQEKFSRNQCKFDEHKF
jgi:hypothetical protein